MDFENYGLIEQPFIDVSVIDVSSKDKRVNGDLYAEKAAHGKLEALLRRIRQKQTISYVSSQSAELGSGKSALMAAAYWKLRKERHDVSPIWAQATGGISAGPTVGRVIDAIISAAHTEKLRQKVGSFTFTAVKDLLSKSYNIPSTQISGKLAEILELPETEIAQKFTNVRRSLLTYSAVDFFGYFLSLFVAAGLPRFVIFLDQFEEYVQAHTGRASLQKLGDDFRDLIQGASTTTSLVLSLHSEAEEILNGIGYVRRVAQIDQNTKITIEPLQEQDGVELAKKYLSAYRPSKYTGSEIFPFEPKVIEHITKTVDGNAGDLMKALGNAITRGLDTETDQITMEFLGEPRNYVSILGKPPPKHLS